MNESIDTTLAAIRALPTGTFLYADKRTVTEGEFLALKSADLIALADEYESMRLAPCVTRSSSTCVYLRDGTKVTIDWRRGSNQGPTLSVEQQLQIKALQPKGGHNVHD